MTVLIADDSAPVRTKIYELLRAIVGVEHVAESCDVESTMSSLCELKPDLLILDLRMPGGGGLEVLKRLSLSEGSRPMIAVLTNYPYPQLSEKCLDFGVQLFLDKSADFGVLQDLCARWDTLVGPDNQHIEKKEQHE